MAIMNTDNLISILKTQKDAISNLEREISLIKNNDLTKENENLRNELDALKIEYQNTKFKLDKTKDENAGLKNALYDQIYSEKLSLIKITREKLDVYFKNGYQEGENRLTSLEKNIKYRIDAMYAKLKVSHVDMADSIYNELDSLSAALRDKINTARLEYSKLNGIFSETEEQQFFDLRNEQLSDSKINELTKKNNLEAFIGKNLINKLGILLIILGVIAASQYTFIKLTPPLKGICMFALGALMLAAGEFLNRKKPNVFSLGITAGGTAVLYTATAISYFYLHILGDYPAILITILITATAFTLSIRYNASVITVFALIGGYFPIFSISGNAVMIYGAMIYFLILNLFALLISFNKKWSVCTFIGLFLNIIGTYYIAFSQQSFTNKFVVIFYVIFTFLIYTAIPVISTYRTKNRFKKSDIIMMAINTLCSAAIMYLCFYSFNFEKYNGLLTILFALTYLCLGKFIQTKLTTEKNASALFYLTGMMFAILIIPIQFKENWLTLGWLIEGVLLTVYGILKEEKTFKRVGYFIDILCLLSFLFFDVTLKINFMFAYKYFAVTLGSVVILVAYITKNQQFEHKFYKALTIINLWFYSIYISNKIGNAFTNSDYLANTLSLISTYIIAYLSIRIRQVSDRYTKIIANILFVISMIFTIYINHSGMPDKNTNILLALTVIVLSNAVAVMSMQTLLRCLIIDRRITIEWQPLVLSGFFIILLTQNLVIQYDLGFSSIILSIIYALTSVAWIIFGFLRKYTFIRRFGLALSMMSAGKLFLIDLYSLDKGHQIVTYFALGISMLIISFIYQYFSKKLEGVMKNEE